MQAEKRSWLRHGVLATALLAAIWSLVLMRRVVLAPASTIPSDVGDPLLNAAILYWNATQVPLTSAWWNFPAYAPAQGVTTFTEHLLGLWPLASPVVWISGNAALAYNVAFFLSFVLNAVTTYLLGKRLTGSDAGALVAAIAFTFNAYRGSQFAHLQMLMTWGMPLALLGLHRFLADGRRSSLVLFGAGWLITGLSNGYYLVFFAVYLACWLLWFGTAPGAWRRVPAIAAAGLIASLPLVPILLTYLDVHGHYGFVRPIEEIRGFSADVSGLFRAHPSATVATRLVPTLHEEGALFSGFTVLALALIGAARGVSRGSETVRHPRLAFAAFAGTIVFLAAAIVAFFTDVRIQTPIRLSISNPNKPLIGFALSFLIWTLASARMRAVIRSRDAALFYGGMAVLMWLFCLGPEARLWGKQLLDVPPYAWLLRLPGIDGLRVPARFWMLALMSLCILAAYAVATVRRYRLAVATVVISVLLAEGWIDVEAAPVPQRSSATLDGTDATLLELPIGNIAEETTAEFRGVLGGYRTVNGYSGHTPPHLFPLELGLRIRDVDVLAQMRQLMSLYVSVKADNSDGYRNWIATTQNDARLVSEAEGRTLYFLPKIPPQPQRIDGAPLQFSISDASCSRNMLRNIVDGALRTRWDCGLAQPGQRLVVDLAKPAQLSGVCLTLGAYSSDTPRHLVVDVSDDGTSWRTVWSGPTASYAFRGAIENPLRSDTRIGWPAARGRYLRLTQTGEAAQWYWSIAELQVLGFSSETAGK